MTSIELPDRVAGASGELLAEPLTNSQLGEQGVVLFWTTELDAAEFLALCDHFVNEPRYVEMLEVIADHEYIQFDPDAITNPDLRAEFDLKLQGRKLVRFNTPAWSVTWFERASKDQPRSVEAYLANIPSAMKTMVSKSVSGVSGSAVAEFLHQLDAVDL